MAMTPMKACRIIGEGKSRRIEGGHHAAHDGDTQRAA